MADGDERPQRIRRSVHFVPGANEKLLEKSLATTADSLVLDLEDAVTPDNKASARQTVTGWLRDVDFGRQERVVRINPFDTPWGRDDVVATMAGPPDAYLVPKIRSVDELHELDEIITAHEDPATDRPVELIALGTETAEGLMVIGDLARCPRVRSLTWGAEDLAAALGSRRNRDANGAYLPVFEYARTMCLVAASAAAVQPLDTVYVDHSDPDGLRAECELTAAMGFTGKISIHPSQIPIINEAFTPSQAEIAEARELLAAFEANQAEGRMAFAFKGQMVDVPHLRTARHIVETAERLEAAN